MTLSRHIICDPRPVAEEIALDAALLASVNAGAKPCWRFWEPAETAVVIGTSAKAADEVHLERAAADGVPVIRRFSGGGAVVQTRGVLNYTVVQRIENADAGSQSVRQCYLRALAPLIDWLRNAGLDVQFAPASDLAVGGRKISGNAQARKRAAYLTHGTLLADPDVATFETYLKHPPREPDYRAGRPHGAFVTTLRALGLPHTPDELKSALVETVPLLPPEAATRAEQEEAGELVRVKFGSEAWNLRK
jgi:lipoate-protein ligase A